MEKPLEIDQLSFYPDEISKEPYPPSGFLPIENASLGNGDCFGLYWPFGHENELPVICEMIHDDRRIQPAFSSTHKFVKWLEVNNDEWAEYMLDDKEFSPFYFNQAKSYLKSNDLDLALPLLELACTKLPEVSEYWIAFSSQLRRQNKTEEFFQTTLNAYLSNWAFGLPPAHVMSSLKKASTFDTFHSDPVVKRSSELTLDYGGMKDNANYPLILECVDEYFELERPITALLLLHNYAYMMVCETTTFQQRYNFDLVEWQTEFSILCKQYLSSSRSF